MITSLSNDSPSNECCNPKEYKVPWGWSWKAQYSELGKAGGLWHLASIGRSGNLCCSTVRIQGSQEKDGAASGKHREPREMDDVVLCEFREMRGCYQNDLQTYMLIPPLTLFEGNWQKKAQMVIMWNKTLRTNYNYHLFVHVIVTLNECSKWGLSVIEEGWITGTGVRS